jgi:hypothetical protein
MDRFLFIYKRYNFLLSVNLPRIQLIAKSGLNRLDFFFLCKYNKLTIFFFFN